MHSCKSFSSWQSWLYTCVFSFFSEQSIKYQNICHHCNYEISQVAGRPVPAFSATSSLAATAPQGVGTATATAQAATASQGVGAATATAQAATASQGVAATSARAAAGIATETATPTSKTATAQAATADHLASSVDEKNSCVNNIADHPASSVEDKVNSAMATILSPRKRSKWDKVHKSINLKKSSAINIAYHLASRVVVFGDASVASMSTIATNVDSLSSPLEVAVADALLKTTALPPVVEEAPLEVAV